MIVEVTQEHIDKGKPLNGSSCPIALALHEHYPAAHVSATVWLPLGLRNQTDTRSLSLRAQQFVARFDSGKPVKPARFRL